MLQQFVKLHNSPPLRFPNFFPSLPKKALSNLSSEPNTSGSVGQIEADHVSFISVLVDDYRSSAVPVAFTVGANGVFTDPDISSARFYGFAQYRPRSSPTPDQNAVTYLFPLQISGVGRSFSVEDAFSVLPPADPTSVLVAGLAFTSGKGVSLTASVRAVLKDGPVYQPNK